MSEEDRQLMINSGNPNTGAMRKYSFMKAPAELQAEIIDGLDSRRLTFNEAAKVCLQSGFEISGESIRRFYTGLLATRRSDSFSSAWKKAADVLREMGNGDKVIETFMAYMTSQMMAGIELGQIEFPVKEFMKFMETFPVFLAKMGQLPGFMPGGNAKKVPGSVVSPVSDKGKLQIRKDVYGF
ncbi:MAG: hypothetical protein LLG06_04175 [Desulfobacteraceae bacterium]|nr:hypothetical protein [Desulfobacteraceae bacterium]